MYETYKAITRTFFANGQIAKGDTYCTRLRGSFAKDGREEWKHTKHALCFVQKKSYEDQGLLFYT